MAITVGRTLDEITKKTRELNKEVRGLTGQNRELDKSLKLDSTNVDLLNKRANNTTNSIDKLQQKIALLKERQKEANEQLKAGTITETQYEKLETDIIKAERELKQLNNELKVTNQTILALPAEKFKALGDNLESAGRALTPLSVAAAAALAGITALGVGTVSAADDLQTYADQLGITAEELQLLNYTALQTDVSQQSMRRAFQKTQIAIGKSLTGEVNAATRAIQTLNLNAEDLV